GMVRGRHGIILTWRSGSLANSPSALATHQRRLQLGPPGFGFRVVRPEAGTEFPVGPGEAAPLRLLDDKRRPAGTRLDVGFLVNPELAQEDRPVVLLGPGGDLLERAADGLLLHLAAGPFAAFPFSRAVGPRGALMSELVGIVEVDCHHETAIILGQLQLFECP